MAAPNRFLAAFPNRHHNIAIRGKGHCNEPYMTLLGLMVVRWGARGAI